MLAKRRKREKGKQNTNSGKYGQVKLRVSKRGIYSCLFALGCMVCLAAMLYVAYTTYGEAPTLIGSIGLVTVVNAGLGIYYGVIGFREREKSYLSCKVGIGMNGFLILIFLFIFIRGLF